MSTHYRITRQDRGTHGIYYRVEECVMVRDNWHFWRAPTMQWRHARTWNNDFGFDSMCFRLRTYDHFGSACEALVKLIRFDLQTPKSKWSQWTAVDAQTVKSDASYYAKTTAERDAIKDRID